jgi:hypothetical protein
MAPDESRRIVWMTRAHPTKKSDAKASNSQLAQPPCVRRGRCCPGSIRTAGCPTDPRPTDCRGRAGGAPQAWSAGRRRSARDPHAEIAARDRRPRRGDVTVDQLAHPAHLTPRTGRTASKTTRTQRRSRARWRSFTSLATTTSKASPVQWNQTGTGWALRRCGRSSALPERALPAGTAAVRPRLGSLLGA